MIAVLGEWSEGSFTTKGSVDLDLHSPFLYSVLYLSDVCKIVYLLCPSEDVKKKQAYHTLSTYSP